MKQSDNKSVKRKPHEYSFTLLEVIIATGLLVSVVLQVAGGQGSLLEITDYSKKATEATWLAKRILSQVEANYANYEFALMDQELKDQKFEGYKDQEADFKYTLKIEEWKIPLIEFLTGGNERSEEEKDQDQEDGNKDSALAGIAGIDGMIKQVFGDHFIKLATVDVSWPEGALRNSVSLSYVMTNQKKIDEYLISKVGIWDQVRMKMDPNSGAGKQGGGGGGGGGDGGTGAGGSGAGGAGAGGAGAGGAGAGGAGAGGAGAGGSGVGGGAGVGGSSPPAP